MNNQNDLFSCRNICWVILIVLGIFLMLWLNNFLWLILAFIIAAAAVILVGIKGIPMVCGDEAEAAAPTRQATRAPAAAPPPEAPEPQAPEAVSTAESAAAAEPETPSEPEPETPSEPEPAAAEAPTAKPAPAPKIPAPAPEGVAEDDLTRINGIGKVLAQGMKDNGITAFAQIAAWGPEEIHWADNDLAKFKGRCTRDDWVGQAKKLAGQ